MVGLWVQRACCRLPSQQGQAAGLLTDTLLPCLCDLQESYVPNYYSVIKNPMDLGTIKGEQ